MARAVTQAVQLPENVTTEKGVEGRVPRPTGILQSISVLLEFDAHICAIAEQRRIAGIARNRIGIQFCGPQKVAGYSDKAGQLVG
jgi:hypothetical protein